MRHPTGKARLQHGPQIAAHIEVARAWSTAQPFHRSAGSEIHVEFPHVHRHRARGLINVGDHQRPYFVSAPRDGGEILNVGALEDDVRHRNQQCLVIDGAKQLLLWNGDPVHAMEP